MTAAGAASASEQSLSEAQIARVTGLLETCVAALSSESSAGFDGFSKQDGFVPVAYLSYEQWSAPEGDYDIIFGQRGDKRGRPFVCDVLRNADGGSFLTQDPLDRRLVAWINKLPATEIAGIRFARDASFKNDINAARLSACIGGQRMVLRGDITNKGAARLGVAPPLREVVQC